MFGMHFLEINILLAYVLYDLIYFFCLKLDDILGGKRE